MSEPVKKGIYHYEDEDDGKVLSKSQIKRALCSDQSKAVTVNRDLTDDQIRVFVVSVLVRFAKMDMMTAKNIMTHKSVGVMRRAFTHWTFNSEYNYEVLETLGDTTYNKVVIDYIYRRFPDLNHDPDGNYKLTESSKLYKSKLTAPGFSDRLGLPQMAIYRSLFYRPQEKVHPNKIVQIKMDQKMKTDLLEAFIAAVEGLIDEHHGEFTGYKYVYRMLATLLDEIDIKIDLADTKNNKSKLKEVTDRLNCSVNYYKINHDASQGVELVLRFIQPMQTRKSTINTMRFTSNNRVYDAACEETSYQALNWLQTECNKSW